GVHRGHEVGERLRDGAVPRELPLVDEDRAERRGHRLRTRAQVPEVANRHRDVRAHLPHAVGADRGDVPARHDGRGHAGDAMPIRREVVALVALVIAALALWVVGVGHLDVHRSMEASRALVSQQMLENGDYVVPRRGAEVYLAKPPLYNWAVVLASAWTGGRV